MPFEGFRVWPVTLFLVFLLSTCSADARPPGSAGQEQIASPQPTVVFIPRTEVPRPLLAPGTDIFQPQDWDQLLLGSVNPQNRHLFMAANASDPQTVANQVPLVLEYYRSTMPALGWHLAKDIPPGPAQEGFPAEAVHAGQVWRKGENLGVIIGVETWAQWAQPPEIAGWRLNVMVITSDEFAGFEDLDA